MVLRGCRELLGKARVVALRVAVLFAATGVWNFTFAIRSGSLRITSINGRSTMPHTCEPLLAPRWQSVPGFSSDPIDAFRHFAHDLRNFCQSFLVGSDEEFNDIASRADTSVRRRLP